MILSSRLLYFPSDKDLSISNRYFRFNLSKYFQFFSTINWTCRACCGRCVSVWIDCVYDLEFGYHALFSNQTKVAVTCI